MTIASGKVVHGRVELDAELPEEASVTVIAADDDTFEADPATEKMLLAAIAECERGRTVPLGKVLSDLRGRERATDSQSLSAHSPKHRSA